MNDICKNCIHFKELKFNFTVGKGFEHSTCCVLFANDNTNNNIGFVVQVTENDRCECFHDRSNA